MIRATGMHIRAHAHTRECARAHAHAPVNEGDSSVFHSDAAPGRGGGQGVEEVGWHTSM